MSCGEGWKMKKILKSEDGIIVLILAVIGVVAIVVWGVRHL